MTTSTTVTTTNVPAEITDYVAGLEALAKANANVLSTYADVGLYSALTAVMASVASATITTSIAVQLAAIKK